MCLCMPMYVKEHLGQSVSSVMEGVADWSEMKWRWRGYKPIIILYENNRDILWEVRYFCVEIQGYCSLIDGVVWEWSGLTPVSTVCRWCTTHQDKLYTGYTVYIHIHHMQQHASLLYRCTAYTTLLLYISAHYVGTYFHVYIGSWDV